MPHYFFSGYLLLLLGIGAFQYLNTPAVASSVTPTYSDIRGSVSTAPESITSGVFATSAAPTTSGISTATGAVTSTGFVATAVPEKPGFSHPAGTFTDPFDLYLSAGEDTEIYYTTDGSLPGISSTRLWPVSARTCRW